MTRLAIALSVLTALGTGCGGQEPPAIPPPITGTAPVIPANVSPGKEASVAVAETSPVRASDGHGHAAPHGGSLIEFGDEFAHLELVLNADTGRLTLYSLDGEAEKPVRLSQPSISMVVTVPDVLSPINVTLEPVENALTGERAGDTSQFDATVPELKGRRSFKGTVTALTSRGQSFSRVRFEFPATEH